MNRQTKSEQIACFYEKLTRIILLTFIHLGRRFLLSSDAEGVCACVRLFPFSEAKPELAERRDLRPVVVVAVGGSAAVASAAASLFAGPALLPHGCAAAVVGGHTVAPPRTPILTRFGRPSSVPALGAGERCSVGCAPPSSVSVFRLLSSSCSDATMTQPAPYPPVAAAVAGAGVEPCVSVCSEPLMVLHLGRRGGGGGGGLRVASAAGRSLARDVHRDGQLRHELVLVLVLARAAALGCDGGLLRGPVLLQQLQRRRCVRRALPSRCHLRRRLERKVFFLVAAHDDWEEREVDGGREVGLALAHGSEVRPFRARVEDKVKRDELEILLDVRQPVLLFQRRPPARRHPELSPSLVQVHQHPPRHRVQHLNRPDQAVLLPPVIQHLVRDVVQVERPEGWGVRVWMIKLSETPLTYHVREVEPLRLLLQNVLRIHAPVPISSPCALQRPVHEQTPLVR
mmetsp:Transcript_26538/g.87004  ORF Transcript_26538/g.87004 Transcript_26538/m.87004 type:complete len:456 (-) Transcript_26538:123-1490(-)